MMQNQRNKQSTQRATQRASRFSPASLQNSTADERSLLAVFLGVLRSNRGTITPAENLIQSLVMLYELRQPAPKQIHSLVEESDAHFADLRAALKHLGTTEVECLQ